MSKATTKYKTLSLSKFGWKRVVRCFLRFGWRMSGATEHITETITDHYVDGLYEKTTTSTNTRIYVDLVRDSAWYTNLPSIFLLEFIFRIALLARRILGFAIPFLIIGVVLMNATGNSDLMNAESPFMMTFTIVLFSWVGLIILKQILSRVAWKILKFRS